MPIARPRATVPQALVVTACVGLGACSNVVTQNVEPSEIAQDCTSDDDDNDDNINCTDPNKFPTICEVSGGDSITPNSLMQLTNPPVVGWGDAYHPGSGPFPCWAWVSTFSRGYVRFNLNNLIGPVESIEGAALTWKTKKLDGASSTSSCVKALYAATGPWKWSKGGPPGTLLYDNLATTAAGAGYYPVGEQVKKWWATPAANYGFFLVPTRASTVAKSNSRCLESLEDLRLTVKYRQKKVPWPGQ